MSNSASRASSPATAPPSSATGPPQSHANKTDQGLPRRVYGRCRVLHCPRPAELKWMSFPGQPNFLATWAVCGEHFVRLSAGERWASRRGRFPTFGRWLLMGDEVESCPRPDF